MFLLERKTRRALGYEEGGRIARSENQFLGDLSEGVPPVPIPNTEVKPFSPDCTARASVWETRKSPG